MNVFASFSTRYGLQGLIALASLASIFLAGGLRELGIGLFLLTGGGILLKHRPTASVSPLLWILGSGIVICGFLPFFLLRLNSDLVFLNVSMRTDLRRSNRSLLILS